MSLQFFIERKPIATLATDGSNVLAYEPAWRDDPVSFPISLTMPLETKEHPARVVIPWLMNLLPEGEPLRAVTQVLGIARDDLLGLVAKIGREVAGAICIGSGRPTDAPHHIPIRGPKELERIINELPARPFLVGDEGVSMSLAGAQDKLPLGALDGELAIPTAGASSTHILKPDNPRLPGSVQNEGLCMVLARLCGLQTAEVTTGLAGQRSYLLVTRYDRATEAGRTRRIHQEDLCQALGRPPSAKYQHNQSGVSGPSLAEMFGLVREHMTARDITRLLDAVIFNIAIDNVDSHAKNYSILLQPDRIDLAPLYDLMSGLDWANITQNHAQDVGGQRRGRHIYGRHWRRMAQECGLAGPATVRRVRAMTERVLAELPNAVTEVAAMPAGGERLETLAAAIAERAQIVHDHASVEGPDEPDAPAEPTAAVTQYDR